jgi:hypothetical protein
LQHSIALSAAAHDSTRQHTTAQQEAETMTDSTNMVKSNSGTGTGSASGFTYENFHLDPQDFQNFLLINPPLTEYSSHYYMNMSKPQQQNVQQQHLEQHQHQLEQQQSQAQSQAQAPMSIPAHSHSHSHSHPQQTQTNNYGAQSDPVELIEQLITPAGMEPTLMQPPSYTAPPQRASFAVSGTVLPEFQFTGSGSGTGTGTGGINRHAQGHLQEHSRNIQGQNHHVQAQSQSHPQMSFQHPQQQLPPQSTMTFEDIHFEDPPLPTRRLSISNGQIGQISMMVHSLYNHGHNHGHGNNYESAATTATNSNSVMSGSPGDMSGGVMVSRTGQPTIQLDNGTTDLTENGDVSVNVPVHVTNQGNINVGVDSQIEVDNNGVPRRPLIYNNEVIFNPNGPIPGTNAWKRAKILERNRIAASKCRAKKKNMQKKLEEDVAVLQEENDKLKSMMKDLRGRIVRYCEKTGVGLDVILAAENSTNDTVTSSLQDSAVAPRTRRSESDVNMKTKDNTKTKVKVKVDEEELEKELERQMNLELERKKREEEQRLLVLEQQRAREDAARVRSEVNTFIKDGVV